MSEAVVALHPAQKDWVLDTLREERNRVLAERDGVAAQLVPLDERLSQLSAAISALGGEAKVPEKIPAMAHRARRRGIVAAIRGIFQSRADTITTREIRLTLTRQGYEIGPQGLPLLTQMAFRGEIVHVSRCVWKAA